MRPEDFSPGATVSHASLGQGMVICVVQRTPALDAFVLVRFDRDFVASWALSKIGQPAHIFTDAWFVANPFTLKLGKPLP